VIVGVSVAAFTVAPDAEAVDDKKPFEPVRCETADATTPALLAGSAARLCCAGPGSVVFDSTTGRVDMAGVAFAGVTGPEGAVLETAGAVALPSVCLSGGDLTFAEFPCPAGDAV
jgi:hypothetical protein